MKNLPKIDDSLWLIVLSLLILILGFTFKEPSFETTEIDLIVWGLLSGTLYALVNVNDKRAISGRKAIKNKGYNAVDEPPAFLSEIDYLAVGSIITVILTWLSLLFLYGIYGHQADYEFSNIFKDIKTAFLLRFPITTLPGISQLVFMKSWWPLHNFGGGIPFAFLYTGFFTILLTLSSFKLFQFAGLDYFARWLACQMIVSLFAGYFLFNEKLSFNTIVIIGFLVLFFFLTSISYPRRSAKQEGHPSIWGVLFLVFAFFRDLFIRGAMLELNSYEKLFVSFCFRAAYFTVFLLIPITIILIRTLKNKRDNSKSGEKKFLFNKMQTAKLLLPFTTAFILVLVFTLQTPVVANSLALGPLSLQVGNILVVSFVGLFYKTEGTKPTLRGRFSEIFLRREEGVKKYLYLIAYILFLLTTIIWIYLSFLKKL